MRFRNYFTSIPSYALNLLIILPFLGFSINAECLESTKTYTTQALTYPDGGGEVRIIVPQKMPVRGVEISKWVLEAHKEYVKFWGEVPKVNVTISFVSLADYRKLPQAPNWSNGLIVGQTIYVPIETESNKNIVQRDLTDIKTTIRHEYSHAFVHTLTSTPLPTWLDEGFAMILSEEGTKELESMSDEYNISTNKNKKDKLTSNESSYVRMAPSQALLAYGEALARTRKLIAGHTRQELRRIIRDSNEVARLK